MQITMIKGIAAGLINSGLAAATGATVPPMPILAAGAAVGLLSYGVSLVLFVLALRHIGAARTSAYFSTAPFIGTVMSVALLHEPLSVQVVLAGVLMGIGVYLHLTERHAHQHVHEAMLHEHAHRHDGHHQHAHGPHDPVGEPHVHTHRHIPTTHAHRHFPDIHHRHEH